MNSGKLTVVLLVFAAAAFAQSTEGIPSPGDQVAFP